MEGKVAITLHRGFSGFQARQEPHASAFVTVRDRRPRAGRWVVSLVGILGIACVAVLAGHHWWVALLVTAALLTVAFLKGTSPGTARDWEEYQVLQDRAAVNDGPGHYR